MKKSLFIAVFVIGTFTGNLFAQQRYLDEVFTSVTVTSNDTFGNNLALVGTDTIPQDLLVDIYEPDISLADTLTERPLIIFLHTGSFLSTALVCTGSKTDSATVEMCTQFAKRGYVVAAMGYRLGWNPFEPLQQERLRGLLNALYRGIQDARTCVRWFRKNYETGGNTYGIDTSKFIMFGQGTGGLISYGCATLDKFQEMGLLRFLDSTGQSVVDTSLSGDMYGCWNRPLNMENNCAYSSKIHMAVSYGGALLDTNWLEAGDVPMIALHSPSDPFAPYKTGVDTGIVICPMMCQHVVEVHGTHDVIRIANYLGNNDVLLNGSFTDCWSNRADAVNEGVQGVFPIVVGTAGESTVEWWDPASPGCSPDPDMSKCKGLNYIDTIMGYVNPRIACVLGLASCNYSKACPSQPVCITGIEDEISLNNQVTIYPNPANTSLIIHSKDPSDPILVIELYNATGQMVRRVFNVNITSRYVLKRKGLPNGLYMIKVKTKEGNTMKKVVFE